MFMSMRRSGGSGCECSEMSQSLERVDRDIKNAKDAWALPSHRCRMVRERRNDARGKQ